MAAHIPPRVYAPAVVAIWDSHLWAPPSERRLSFPVGGVWRSFSESDSTDITQVQAVARRFGGLTAAAATKPGERLWLWNQLISDLSYLSLAWTETGAVADPVAVSNARMAGNQMLGVILSEHHRAGGEFVINAGAWTMRCISMAHWWRLTAIVDVRQGDPMRRCRHCRTWFSLTGLRADAGFCSSSHRSAFYQKRPPASRFWAENV